MKKIFITCILFVFIPALLWSQNDEMIEIKEMDRLVRYEADLAGKTFYSLDVDQGFAKKFNLSAKEMEMIGYWTDVYTTKVEQTGKNVNIIDLYIYPNRIMEVSLGIKGYSRPHLFFEWKIQNDLFMVKPVYFISNGSRDSSNKDTKDENVKFEKEDFFVLGKIHPFKKVYILQYQWDYSPVNSVLKSMNFSFGKDTVRMRMLYGDAYPSICERMITNGDLRKFVLSPAPSDPEYLMQLEMAASVMWNYTPDYYTK